MEATPDLPGCISLVVGFELSLNLDLVSVCLLRLATELQVFDINRDTASATGSGQREISESSTM
jgi:hypothetical protein